MSKDKKGISDLEKIELLTKRGKENFYFFCRYILGTMEGFDLIEEVPHHWMCDCAQNWVKQKKLILLPRDTFKTTVFVVAYAIWRMINNPEISILLSSDKALNSEQSLSAIKDVLERHKLFRACYGNLVGDRSWSERQIIISTRTGSKRSPTVMVTGADSEKVGMHFDLIMFDDPHNRKNISTPEQILKIINYYQTLYPCLDSLTGQMQITATRWHHQDVHNHILTHEAGDWDVYIKAAEWVDEVTGEEHNFYPNRLTKDFLNKRKKELTSYFYSCQYLNSPTDDENSTFKKEYFHAFTFDRDFIYVPQKDKLNDLKIPRSSLTFFTLCDPAGRGSLTEQRRLDYTGQIVFGVDARLNWYIFEAYRKRGLQPSDIIADHIRLQNIYNPEVMGIESITYQGQIKAGLELEFNKHAIYQPIRDLEHNGRAKFNRIKGLQPMYKAGKIYHAPGLFDLEMELLTWSPNSTIHDDLIDPLAYGRDIVFAPDAEEAELVSKIGTPHETTFLMDADSAWRREGRRGSFKDFLEDFDQREELSMLKAEEEEVRELVNAIN